MTTACNSRTPYFDCLIQTDKNKKVRAVRFYPSKRVNLQQAYPQNLWQQEELKHKFFQQSGLV